MMIKAGIMILSVAVMTSCCGTSTIQKGHEVCPTCNGIGSIEVMGKVESDAKWESIFDGKTFAGWRGYNRTDVPAQWTIDDGAIKFNGIGKMEVSSPLLMREIMRTFAVHLFIHH